MAEDNTQSSSPHTELQRLDAFVGTWKTKGQVTMPDGSVVEMNGTDSYEWLPGKFFLIHRVVDVRMGDHIANAIEIIGYDTLKQKYFMHAYDNQGHTDIMYASVNNNIWTFSGESARFTGSFSKDGQTLTGTWERSEDGVKWQPWMHIVLTKTQ